MFSSKANTFFYRSTQAANMVFPTPQAYPRVTKENIPLQIGLVQDFYLSKLEKSKDDSLVEDLELPPKQRPGGHRPKLPASGKIAGPPPGANPSPQKRPPPPPFSKSNGSIDGPSKKKVKKNSGAAEEVTTTNANTSTPQPKSGVKLKITLPNNNGDSTTVGDANTTTDADASGDIDDAPMDGSFPNGVHVNGDLKGGMISPESIKT